MDLDDSLTNEDLQDLHEDILDRNEDGVRSLLSEFRGQEAAIKKLCSTEVELEPASHDHPLNELPLSAIHRAALIDSHGILDAILTSVDDVDVDLALARSRYTPLHVACAAGVLAAVNYLTSSGANLVAKDADGRTPMHLAAEYGHKDVLSLLCVRGAPVVARTYADSTPLHLAARRGHADVVDFLLNKGSDINARDKDGRTPLHEAQIAGVADISYSLIDRGADVNAQDNKGQSPVHLWIQNWPAPDKESGREYDDSFPALSALVNCGAEVNLADEKGDTALHLAAETGDTALTEFLLNQGASVDSVNKTGRSALFYAKCPAVARLLLRFGSEANLPDTRRNTVLHVYAGSDDVSATMMEVAVDNGVDVDAQNADGQTALHCACAAGSRDKAELLLRRHGARHDVLDRRGRDALHAALECGADSLALWMFRTIDDVIVDRRDQDGNTPLHLAARSGSVEIVTALMSRDAPTSVRNESGQTPADLAAQGRFLDCLRLMLDRDGVIDPEQGSAVLLDYVQLGDEQTIELLLDQGVDCNARRDACGRMALHVALDLELLRVGQILLDNGADVNALDDAKRSPLHVATGHLPVLEPLLSRLVDSSLRNSCDSSGNTPLHYGIAGCTRESFAMLVRAGCRLDVRNTAGKTPVHCLLDRQAAVGGDCLMEAETLAKLDFARKHDPKSLELRDNEKESVLHAAVRTGSERVLGLILGSSVSVNWPNSRLRTVLHCACAIGNSKMASLLMECGAHLDIRDSDGRSPIFDAVLSRNIESVLLLIRKGCDVNLQDATGKTCLMVAMEMGQSTMCQRMLMESAVDVSLVDDRGCSLLFYAARHCSRHVVDVVLDHGADVDVGDASSSMTPLHAASANDDVDVMAALLSADATIDARDRHGNTTLHLCAERGSYSHVKLLLDHGADPEIENAFGRTAAHLAAMAKDADVIELLIANEADIDVTDADGNTPLALSIVHGNVEISSDLLDQGADVTIRNASGDTALHHAVRMPQLDRKLLKLLVRRCRTCLEATNSSGQTPLDILKSRTDLDLDGIALDMGLE